MNPPLIKILIMEVKLLKDHYPHKKGDIVEVPQMRGLYWQAIGVAEQVKSKVKEDKI